MRKLILAAAMTLLNIAAVASCASQPPTSESGAQQEAQSSCPFFSKKMLTGSIVGAAVGAGAGALATKGKSLTAILVGAAAGALLAGAVGKSLDTQDCQQARAAMQRMALAPIGTQVDWVNPESGNRGSQTATSDPAMNASGQLCRSYHETVILKNNPQPQMQDGTTCRDDNGDWHAIS